MILPNVHDLMPAMLAVMGFQIGPKIRVGGTLGKIGQNVKIATGKALSNPIVDAALNFVPGVGPGLAAGLATAGKALDTSHGSVSLGSLAKTGGASYLGGKLLSHIPGADKLKSTLGGLPGVSAVTDFLHGHANPQVGPDGQPLAPGSGDQMGDTGSPGAVQGIMDFLKNHGDALLGAAGTVNAGIQQGKASGLMQEAKDQALRSYDTRAPLRTGGVTAMTNVLANNPYAQKPQPGAGSVTPLTSYR